MTILYKIPFCTFADSDKMISFLDSMPEFPTVHLCVVLSVKLRMMKEYQVVYSNNTLDAAFMDTDR